MQIDRMHIKKVKEKNHFTFMYFYLTVAFLSYLVIFFLLLIHQQSIYVSLYSTFIHTTYTWIRQAISYQSMTKNVFTKKSFHFHIFFVRIKGRIMCNWLKSIGDWKSIAKFFDKNSEILLQFTLLVVNHVDWVKSIAINETQLELP